jgi:thiaminase/transcriptional activator TenA
MLWSEQAWQRTAFIYKEIIGMPFIQELIAGTLPIEKFKFYISQDALYLEQFGRALSLIAARSYTVNQVLEYTRFAEGAIVVENALHGAYFEQYNISGKVAISPSCHHYTSFLLSTCALAPVEVAMAAVLPCFWIYKRVGDYIYAQQPSGEHPYRNWIDTYAGEAFGVLVKRAIDFCDEVANPVQQEAMFQAFEKACRLEWMFWDSAYRLEGWGITESQKF